MEEQLIQLVKNNEILYNKAKPGYKREDLKLKVWGEIAKELKKSVDEVRKRWKTLRDKFHRDRKKNITTTGSAGSPKKLWKFYSEMLFLLDTPCINNKTTSNFKNNSELSASVLYEHFSPDLEIDTDGSLLFDASFHVQEPPSVEPSVAPQNCSDSPSVSESKKENNSPNNNPPYQRKRRRTLQSEELLENTHQEMHKLISTATRSLEIASNTSPIQICFLGLAKQVESTSMSVLQKSQLIVKVTTLVHNEIAESLNLN